MSMYTYIDMHAHAWTCICIRTCIWIWMCICIGMYLYVCACIYLYVYSVIHIRDHRDAAFPQSRAFASKHEPRPWSQRSFFGSTT